MCSAKCPNGEHGNLREAALCVDLFISCIVSVRLFSESGAKVKYSRFKPLIIAEFPNQPSKPSKFAMTDCEDWPTCFFSESFKFTQFASATLKIGSSEEWLKSSMNRPKLCGETLFWYQNNLDAKPLFTIGLTVKFLFEGRICVFF